MSAPPAPPVVSGPSLSRSGVLFAVATYGLWGFAPIYWKQLVQVAAAEILAYRVLGSLIFMAALVGALRIVGPLASDFVPTRGRWLLVSSGLLLACNWWIFIWAVNTDRIVDTSLGYYLTPLLNVGLGLALFRERLSPLQWAAVALAGLAVGYMAWELGRLPWISLVLGASFAVYGALRKYGNASSIGGFTVEIAALVPLAALFLVQREWSGEGVWSGDDDVSVATLALLVGSGAATVPLLLFASAVKRLPLSAVGVFQYIAPSTSLLIAVWLYGEPFTRTHVVTFGLIWSALALYTWDSLRMVRTGVVPVTSGGG